MRIKQSCSCDENSQSKIGKQVPCLSPFANSVSERNILLTVFLPFLSVFIFLVPSKALFLAFFARISYFKILDFKEFNKQLFHSRLLDMRLARSAELAIYHLKSKYPTRDHGIIVKYKAARCEKFPQ